MRLLRNLLNSTNTGVPASEAEILTRGFAGPPVMEESEVLPVPPDGHCLFACAVAARDVGRLRSVMQDNQGFLTSPSEDLELLTACRRLRQIVGAMAADDDRFDVVEQLTSPELPEGAVLTYVSRWLGGSIIVTHEGTSSEYDVIVGSGPIVCKLVLGTVTDAGGRHSPHFQLAGSWLPQLKTRKRSRNESSSSKASS